MKAPIRYKNGQKVKYLTPKGAWAQGKIHAINSHETADGFILDETYLVDTGETMREDVVEVSKKGKTLKVERQPEQVLCSTEQIKPL